MNKKVASNFVKFDVLKVADLRKELVKCELDRNETKILPDLNRFFSNSKTLKISMRMENIQKKLFSRRQTIFLLH